MKKRIFSLLTAIMLCASLLPVSASALSNSEWDYSLKNNGIIIHEYLGPGGHVDIPSEIDGVPVVSVEKFSNVMRINKEVTSITVPDTVTYIGSFCFQSTENLEWVKLGSNVKTIDYQAFGNLEFLKSVNLPESATELEEHLFDGCESLEEVNIPSTLTEIPMCMFSHCKSLRHITIPESVKRIRGSAFAYSGLQEVTIPANVEFIGSFAFTDCKELEKVEFKGRKLTEMEEMCFLGCENLKSIHLPTSTKIIGSRSFFKSGLTGLVVPYGVSRVDFEIVGSCPNLNWMTIPSSAYVDLGNQTDNCPNAVIYCPAGSSAEAAINKRNNISYLTDSSADARVQVIYNGKRISFNAYGQSAVIENGRTMVPLRSIFEAMGAEVQWDNATRTVTATRNGTEIRLAIGDTALYKNGALAATLDVPAHIMNNCTMVPARAIAESFGAEVLWDGVGYIVDIND